MVVDEEQNQPLGEPGPASRLDALVAAGRALADANTLVAALRNIVAAAASALDAEAVIARVLDADGRRLTARAVHASSAALAAELEGTRVPVEDLRAEETDAFEHLPAAVRAAAERVGADRALVLPVAGRGRVLGSVEVLRRGEPLDEVHRIVARLVADQVSAAILAFAPLTAVNGATGRERVLDLAGEALAAGLDAPRVADEVVRLAAQASGARSARVWRPAGDGVEEVAAFGAELDQDEYAWARHLAEDALAADTPVTVAESLPEEGVATAVTLRLGKPPSDLLQLLFERDAAPDGRDVDRLATFALRAAATLRAGARAGLVEQELERARTLLSVVAQVNADLSLTRTLETFVARVAELLDVDRVCVYLREDGRLVPAAERGLAGPHTPVAERLFALALARPRGQGVFVVESAGGDARLAALRSELAETGIEAAIAVPLRVPDEVTGLLAVYPSRRRRLTANESALLTALAARLAVALQNAKLHEEATRYRVELEDVLALERKGASQLRALYEISRSFAQSLSLDATLDAVVRTVVDLLEVDAAVLRMPDERGELLVALRIHVADDRLRPSLEPILSRPQPIDKLPGRRLFRMGKALRLDTRSAGRFGGAHQALVPFLEKGATAVVLPIATPNDLLGTLKLLSLDPERPITEEEVEIGLTVATQAALAIDNARLYQQQKAFSDAMQRSLLPRSRPDLPGIEVGEVYESSARVDVGGDVYDFLTLDDGRLAVVIGDVTGHGIDAAADMAMAKFVFRSIAREHPEPADFLAAANAVVCGEIAAGKFITMLYLTLDPATGIVSCAGAGHPEPRVVLPDGSVRSLHARGLALGIEEDQSYDEVREELPVGATVVLYTDGVIEARRAGEFYGTERLDAVLSERRELPAVELARRCSGAASSAAASSPTTARSS